MGGSSSEFPSFGELMRRLNPSSGTRLPDPLGKGFNPLPEYPFPLPSLQETARPASDTVGSPDAGPFTASLAKNFLSRTPNLENLFGDIVRTVVVPPPRFVTDKGGDPFVSALGGEVPKYVPPMGSPMMSGASLERLAEAISKEAEAISKLASAIFLLASKP